MNTEQENSAAVGPSGLSAGLERETIMQQWDRWRSYIANGGTASWPRDEFESLLDAYDEIISDLRSNVELTGSALLRSPR